ncbi:hypothetical protein TWF694_002862 [Orbilia ellipsospora]|uniref:Uncharacterized protein n=1 Tax=Orbilia ellipsospora TaxID=2528407 RepID=A0AAV9X113_9PEZI
MGAKSKDPIRHTRCVGKPTRHYGTMPDPNYITDTEIKSEEVSLPTKTPIPPARKFHGLTLEQSEDEELKSIMSEIFNKTYSVWANGEPQNELERYNLKFGYLDGTVHWYLVPPSEFESTNEQQREQGKVQEEEAEVETREETSRRRREAHLEEVEKFFHPERWRHDRREILGETDASDFRELEDRLFGLTRPMQPKTIRNKFRGGELCTLEPQYLGSLWPEYFIREFPTLDILPEVEEVVEEQEAEYIVPKPVEQPKLSPQVQPEPCIFPSPPLTPPELELTWRGYVAKDKEGRAIVDYLIRQGHPAPIPCDGRGICVVGTTKHFHDHERERKRARMRCGLVGNNKANRALLTWFDIPLSSEHLEAVYMAREFGEVEMLVEIYREWNPDRPIVALPPAFPRPIWESS